MSNEVKRYTDIELSSRLAFESMPSEYVSASDFDALRAENEQLKREARNDAVAYKAVIDRQEELRTELQALKGGGVPDGYVLVPVEPTYEMLDAKHEDGDGYAVSEDEYYFSNREAVRRFMNYVWARMLAAAPQPAEKAQQAGRQEPIKLQHMAVAEDGVLRWMPGRKLYNCELYAMPDFGRAPALYTAPQSAPEVIGLVEALELFDRVMPKHGWPEKYDDLRRLEIAADKARSALAAHRAQHQAQGGEE